MRVLVACEKSQVVCKAFRARGHEAYSNDIQESSGGHPEWHLKMDAIQALGVMRWDMLIAFPPCTYLSSVQTFRCRASEQRVLKRLDAAKFFMQLYTSGIDKISIENPTGVMTHIFRSPDQVIHPFYFGDGDFKRTCLWLKGLPKLIHRDTADLFSESTHGTPPPIVKSWVQASTGKVKNQRYVNTPFLSAELRSNLSPLIAEAMAEQWGGTI